uniref:Uncharacterized protein n=1 Tax=Anopheles minimus TaxID=112268 RepID=A0A182WQE0_9DIPT
MLGATNIGVDVQASKRETVVVSWSHYYWPSNIAHVQACNTRVSALALCLLFATQQKVIHTGRRNQAMGENRKNMKKFLSKYTMMIMIMMMMIMMMMI